APPGLSNRTACVIHPSLQLRYSPSSSASLIFEEYVLPKLKGGSAKTMSTDSNDSNMNSLCFHEGIRFRSNGFHVNHSLNLNLCRTTQETSSCECFESDTVI